MTPFFTRLHSKFHVGSSMFNVLPLLLFLLTAALPTQAQPPVGENPSDLITVPAGGKFLRWYGYTGRTYFIQVSDANNPLANWNWVPVIEAGHNGYISYEVDGTAPKTFFRLKPTDLPIPSGKTIDTADFDNDGISNIDEINPPPPLPASAATDPLASDSDHDGLPDYWERSYGTNPNDDATTNPNSGPAGDPDGDGLTNFQEYTYHTDPMDFGNRTTNTLQDSDGNGLPDWWEILHFGALGNNPNQVMVSNDGLTLKEIFDNDLTLGVSATMSDGIPDSWKIAHELDPTDPDVANKDFDTDGLSNLDEYEAGTHPNNPDTDGDTIIDGQDLYPLIPDPSVPSNFYVGVPSWDEQNQSLEPDWQAVDYTTVELRWEGSSNGPDNYKVERRCDNDIWQPLATVSGTATTYEDSSLVANRNYEYRISAAKDAVGTQISSWVTIANYQVPLNLRMHAKTASISQSKGGFQEFAAPSSPPKHYLKKIEISSHTATAGSNNSGYSNSTQWGGNYSYTSVLAPSLKKWSYVGARSTSYNTSNNDITGTSTTSESTSKNYNWMVQSRSRQSLVAITQGGRTHNSQTNSSTPSSSTSSSSGDTGSYLQEGTYVPTVGMARWEGADYDMSKGVVNFSGNSTFSSHQNPSGGPNVTETAQATASGTGSSRWTGTSTNTSGQTSTINNPAFSDYWPYSDWFGGLQSTTQTQRIYSTSFSGGYNNYASSSQGTHTLTDEYTTAAFVADTIENVPDYQDEWIEDYWGWGTWNPGDEWYYGYGTNGYGWEAAAWNLSATESSLSISKFKYKFTANPSAPTTIRWVEIFVPDDNEDTIDIDESQQIEIIAERTWNLTASENESPEFEIDPTATPPSRNGHFDILLRPLSVIVSGIGEAGKNVTGQDSSPGKVALINDGDADNDGIADYADGYDRNPAAAADNESPGVSFVPVHIAFRAVDPAKAKIKFTFDASDPQGITRDAANPHRLPVNGKIRLWTKDGSQQRNADSISQGGDLIKPGVPYSLEDLGLADSTWVDLTVFAELVKTSDPVADIAVKIEIKPNANLGFVFSDQVRFTGVKIETFGRGYGETEFTQGIPFAASNLKDFDTKVAMFGSTPGAFSIYKVRIFDPRSNVGNLRVQDQQVSLTRDSGAWETPEFVFLGPGGQNDYSICPQLRLRIAGPSVALSYNPATIEKFLNTNKIDPVIQQAYSVVDQAQKALKAGGWTPPPGTTNPGLFGNEVHQWVSEYFAPTNGTPRQGWVADVFVDNGTGVVLSIGELPPGGVARTTQIDLMSVKGTYRPVVNRPLDPKKVLQVFDIKTSARISADDIGPFVDRIYALTGKDKLYLPQVQERYSIPKEGWFSNKSVVRFKKLAKWCAALGVVASLAVLPESEAKADECVKYAIEYRSALKGGSFADINVAQIQFFLKMQEFMSLYSQSPIQDGINNIALTKWLLTEDAKVFDEDPEYDSP